MACLMSVSEETQVLRFSVNIKDFFKKAPTRSDK